MQETKYQCPDCQKPLTETQIKTHIKNCHDYQPLILKQIQKLPQNLPLKDLKFISAQIQLANEQIRRRMKELNPIQKQSSFKSQLLSSSMAKSPMQIDISAYDQDIVSCKNCKKKFYASFDIAQLFYVQQCWHLFCNPCVLKYIDNQFVNKGGALPCLSQGCKKNIPDYQIKITIGDKKFETLQNKSIRKLMNIVQCFKCLGQYDFAEGKASDAPKKDLNGKQLSAESAKHFAANRFVCSNCKTQQCKQCQTTPFHTGMTCKQFKAHALAQKCRYCDTPLTDKNTGKYQYSAFKDICTNAECQDLMDNACTKVLHCGHPCCGFRGQKQCLPCLNEKCCQSNEQLNGQCGDDYCAICYVQSLSASPCIRSGCGHIFHMKCIQKRLQIKWLTPRILFNFCLCPLCKRWINLPQQNKLAKQIFQNSQLFKKVQQMSLQRLKFQGSDKDDKLKDKASPYFEKPTEYGMAIYAYFMCFKCKKPYFGGRKNCADAMNQGQNAVDYKKQELICPNCCQIPIEDCNKHGKDFIQFKCKFCCSTAQWFCWGNTHFCQSCHKRQCSGDYVSKYTKQQLPKCLGPSKCSIGGNHNGNGEEKTLGCAICRNYKQNNKGF